MVKFLRWVKTVVDVRYAHEFGHITNYEDIYFIANQIREDLLDELDNPALQPLIQKLIVEFLLMEARDSHKLKNQIEKLTTAATEYIRSHIAKALTVRPIKFEHLDFIVEAIQDVGEKNIILMTLNHDTLIEVQLNAHNICFVDGFTKTHARKIRTWQPSSFVNAGQSVRLLKLHGGCNWYRFRPEKAAPWFEDYIGIPTSKAAIKDEQERRHCNLDPSPMFLIGTFNKLISYTDPVYLEIYHQAFLALRDADVLIVIGYGFGDKGINKLVLDWIYRFQNRQLVVVDKHANTLWQYARGAISQKRLELLETKRLILLQRDLNKHKLQWKEVINALDATPA